MTSFRPTVLPWRWLRHSLAALTLAAPLAALCPPAQAQDVKLATLDWPPYTSAALPQNGMVSKILQDAARLSGKEVGFGYFPWVRAMRTGRDDPNYMGYFPAYWTPERAQSCNFSEPIGIGRVGLVQRRDHPVNWSDLIDLKDVTIGVTAGYSNGPKFDAMVKEGILHVQEAPADIDNVRMVSRGRIPVAVVEHWVFDYSLITDPDLQFNADDLEFNPRPIAELPLYVCFKKTPEGARWKQIFDAGLKQIDLLTAQQAYMQALRDSKKKTTPLP